jgi:hypothetical protein
LCSGKIIKVKEEFRLISKE